MLPVEQESKMTQSAIPQSEKPQEVAGLSVFFITLFNVICLINFVIPVVLFVMPKHILLFLNISTEKIWGYGPILYIIYFIVAGPICLIANAILVGILARNKKFGPFTLFFMFVFLIFLFVSMCSVLLFK